MTHGDVDAAHEQYRGGVDALDRRDEAIGGYQCSPGWSKDG
jgi:hypothetical protein